MSEDQEISCSVIDSHVSESNSNAPTPRDDLTIIAQKPTIIGESNSSSDNSGKYFTIIVQNPIIISESNSNPLNYNQASTIEAQNATIIGESDTILPQLSMDFGIDPRYATIFAKQTHIGTNQNFSYDILSSNDPEVKERIGKLMNEVIIDAFERLKNKPDRTDGIPNRVLDYLASKGIKNMKDRNTKGSDKNTNDDVIRSENFQLISVNIDDIPLDKVDVVHGNNYTSIKAKKGFRIVGIFEQEGSWIEGNNEKYVKQILLYNGGGKHYAFLLLNDMSLVSLERTGWNRSWKIIENKFDIIYLIAIKKKYCTASVFEFLTDLHEHFLIIFMPFPSTEIYYKYSLVFEYNDDGNYPLFLSVDLLTGQIMVQLCQVKINHNVTRFQLGHELSDVEKRGEDVPFLENIREFIRIREPNEMDGITSSEKSRSEFWNLIKKIIEFIINILLIRFKLKLCYKSLINTLKRLKVHNGEYENIKILKFNINGKKTDKCYKIKQLGNYINYRPNENVLFDKVLDEKKVIWKMKINELLAKEVYLYFDDNDKWIIIVLDNNTLKFYHKQSDSEKWIDVSTKMLSTDILNVINSNHRKLSRMDLNFDFFSSFCLIDLGDAVSVGYKDYVQYFKEYGIDHSVCLFLDILTKSVHFMEFILNIQNQLTNQH